MSNKYILYYNSGFIILDFEIDRIEKIDLNKNIRRTVNFDFEPNAT